MTASKNQWIRPAWTPVTIAMMVFGFMLHWVLGLAMLAYIVWGDKFESLSNDIRTAADDLAEKFGKESTFSRASRTADAHGATGNEAFDEWRAEEIQRLREERRKLDEEREEFEAYKRDLRREKDREEFETFRRARGTTARSRRDYSDDRDDT